MADYIVRSGDTFYSIARLFNVTTTYLRSLNPEIDDVDNIAAGQTIRVPNVDISRRIIEVNGYTFSDIDRRVLLNLLPYLTYLSILSYRIDPDGGFAGVQDMPLIQMAREAGVAPVMVITNMEAEGGFSGDLAHAILADLQLQQTLINNIVSILKSKNYFGLNIDFEYIYPEDINAYTRFLQMAALSLQPLGYIVIATLNVQIFLDQQNQFSEARTYSDFSRLIDRFIISTNDFVCAYGAFTVVEPVDQVQRALDYASTIILSQKILLGLPNCCLHLEFLDQQKATARLLSPTQAESLIMLTGASLQFELQSQASYFTYGDDTGTEHIVWCGNESATRLPLALVDTYNLGGVSLRTIHNFSPASYQALNTMYEIRKVIDAESG